jgi:hypothetical protein
MTKTLTPGDVVSRWCDNTSWTTTDERVKPNTIVVRNNSLGVIWEITESITIGEQRFVRIREEERIINVNGGPSHELYTFAAILKPMLKRVVPQLEELTTDTKWGYL